MKMPSIPPHDWTRNEESIEKITDDKLNKEPGEKRPWEKKIINLLSAIFAAALVFYTIWYFFLK